MTRIAPLAVVGAAAILLGAPAALARPAPPSQVEAPVAPVAPVAELAVTEAQLETAAQAFEARMKAFEREAETISNDPALTEVQKGMRIATALSAYQPDIEAFTALSAQFALDAVGVSLNALDMTEVVVAAAEGVRQTLMTQPVAGSGEPAMIDPDEMVTYGLVAQHEIHQALEEMDLSVAVAPSILAVAPPAAP